MQALTKSDIMSDIRKDTRKRNWSVDRISEGNKQIFRVDKMSTKMYGSWFKDELLCKFC